ncbi:helix-turn-helix domain-containing protein [Geodermatophilus nigrescens]
MPYPPRAELRPLAAFAGSASPRPDPDVQAHVERSVVEQYTAGRSLRELAELTDRSFSAVRKILDRHGVRRRGVGAARLTTGPLTSLAR